MTIATFDQWIASTKQLIPYSKTAARTTVANRWFALHDLAGNPGAATLAVGNTAAGVVPTDERGETSEWVLKPTRLTVYRRQEFEHLNRGT